MEISRVEQYSNACRHYLSKLGIGDLRSYGREVGVARPTTKNKEDLIEAIVGILSGKLQPIEVSKQGAPVKNDRVDDRILAQIAKLRLEYFPSGVVMDGPDFDFERAYTEFIKTQPGILRVESEIPASWGVAAENKAVGQMEYRMGEYLLLPLDGSQPQERIWISSALIEKMDFREGDILSCYLYVGKDGKKAMEGNIVNFSFPEGYSYRPHYDACVASVPKERIRVYNDRKYDGIANKFIEWLMPIAKGQRACIVAPPKAGKTRLLTEIADAATHVAQDLQVFALVVEQSSETVTEYQKVLGKEQLFYTAYGDDPQRQVELANFLLNRVKRLAEMGKDSLVIVDSISALAHVFNDTDASMGGKTLSCGLEMKTVRYIKKYFGAGRRLDGAGSVTVLCAVDTDTGNPFDEVICSEVSALANYSLRLNGDMAIRRVYPALDFSGKYVKHTDIVKSEAEEDFHFILRNDVLPKLGEEGLLKLLKGSVSYKEFVQKIEEL